MQRKNLVGRLAAGRNAKKSRTTRLALEPLEDRLALSSVTGMEGGANWPYATPVPWQQRASVAQLPMFADEATESDQFLAGKFKLTATRTAGGAVILDNFIVYATAGTDVPFEDVIQSAVLVGDMDNRAGAETYLGSAELVDGVLSFDHFNRTVYVGGYGWAPTLYVYLNTSSIAEVYEGNYKIGIEAEASFKTLRGVELDPRNVAYTGRPTLHRLEIEETVATFAFDGPVSQTVEPGDRNVVFANMDVDINKNGSVLAHDLFFMVEGASNNGTQLSVSDCVDDLELYNTSTGQHVWANPLLWGDGYGQTLAGTDYQIYAISSTDDVDVVLNQWDDWQVRADVTADAHDGDRFRVRLGLGTPSGMTTFGGLLPPSYFTPVITSLGGNVWVETLPEENVAGNWHVVQVSEMAIKALSTISTDTAVLNERDIVLGAFSIYATGSDQLLTGLTVNAEQGNFQSVQYVKMWLDTDGNNVVDTIGGTGILRNGMIDVSFVNGGIVVLAGGPSSIRGEIHADVSGSLIPFNPAFQMAIWGGQAERLSTGSSVNVTVENDSQQTVWSFVTQGSLFVTQDPTPVRSQEMLLGERGGVAQRIRFLAVNESVDVYKIQLLVPSLAAGSIDTLSLSFPGAPAPFAVATIAATGTDSVPAGSAGFTARMSGQQLVAAEGMNTTVIVTPMTKSDVNGGVPGRTFSVTVGSVLGRGVSSSRNLLENNGDAIDNGEVFVGVQAPGPSQPVVSTIHTLVGSKLTGIVNGGPAEAAMPLGTNCEIGVFSFTTAQNDNFQYDINSYVLDTLPFTVAAVNVALESQSFSIVNLANPTVFVTASSVVPMGSSYQVTFTGLSEYDWFDASIESGSTEQFAIRVTITNPNTTAASGGSSFLQTHLELRDNFFSRLDEDFGVSVRINGSGLPETLASGTRHRG